MVFGARAYARQMGTTSGATTSGHRPNQRASSRHDVAIEARLDVGGVSIPCTLTNLSQGGAFAQVDKLAMGTSVKLAFSIDANGDVIETTAIVRWAAHDGIGLQFGGLRARDAWALGQFLRRGSSRGADLRT